MNKVYYKNTRAHPIGLRKIVKGNVKGFENPITHEVTNVTGKVLYDISQKQTNYLVIVRNTN